MSSWPCNKNTRYFLIFFDHWVCIALFFFYDSGWRSSLGINRIQGQSRSLYQYYSLTSQQLILFLSLLFQGFGFVGRSNGYHCSPQRRSNFSPFLFSSCFYSFLFSAVLDSKRKWSEFFGKNLKFLQATPLLLNECLHQSVISFSLYLNFCCCNCCVCAETNSPSPTMPEKCHIRE